MITFILLGVFAMLAIAFIALAWGANNRRRKGQAEVTTEQAAAAKPTVARATPPDQ